MYRVRAGRVIAGGSPEQLKAQAGGDRLAVVVAADAQLAAAVVVVVATVATSPPEVDWEARRISAPVAQRVAALTEAVGSLADAAIDVDDISLRRHMLDDVFLRLTGHRAESPIVITVLTLPLAVRPFRRLSR